MFRSEVGRGADLTLAPRDEASEFLEAFLMPARWRQCVTTVTV